MTEAPAPDRANSIPWPPIIYVLALAGPWLAGSAMPLPVIALDRPFDDVMVAIGWALIAWGLALGYFAIRSFAGFGTAVSPTSPADRLVTFGLYARTRNPMYLGAVIALAGIGLSTGDPWRLIAVPLAAVALHRLAILPEEAYLDRRFGDTYRRYLETSRRWF
jgi:protein-S-isoprenylcysteine O-methyltransferase Ste14